tara:strand:- start:719 stop:952 length:234 start_codon:yes stop_codon:yes gene_type:complete
MTVKKTMDHGAYQRKTKAMTEEELYYTMRDCKQAMEANPNGINDGYYADEINYCSMELYQRKQVLLRSSPYWVNKRR